MKALPWILIALFAALLGAGLWDRFRPVPVIDPPTITQVRDSIRIQRDTVRIQTTAYITKIQRIPADTLGPILRALAARPLVQGPDTIRPEPEDTTCRVWLTCEEGRRLAIRDTLKQVAQDSTKGDIRIQEVRAVDQNLNQKKPWGYVAAFEAGYLAGTIVTGTICAVVR